MASEIYRPAKRSLHYSREFAITLGDIEIICPLRTAVSAKIQERLFRQELFLALHPLKNCRPKRIPDCDHH
jgi:hypothetical protein